MIRHTKLVTPTTGPPVTLGEAKVHLRVTDAAEDADIRRKVNAATEFCQRRIPGHRQFMPATWDFVMDGFPDSITLPLPPAQSIKWIKYYDADGTLTTLVSTATSTAIVSMFPTDDPATIEPAYGSAWPTVRAQLDAVTVRYVAGYEDREAVPDTIKEAILLTLGHYYENREAVAVGAPSHEVQMSVDSLLNVNAHGHYL